MILEIQGFEIRCDGAFALDILASLSVFHGRLGKQINNTTDMTKGTEAAKTIIAVQAAYNEVERRYEAKARNDAHKDTQPGATQ
jgi:hypothetical protein